MLKKGHLWSPSYGCQLELSRVSWHVQAAMTVAKQLKYCQRGDSVVAVHRIGHSAVIKISEVK